MNMSDSIGIHLADPSDLSLEMAAIDPRWPYVPALASLPIHGVPQIMGKTLGPFDESAVASQSVINTGDPHYNTLRGHGLGRLERERGPTTALVGHSHHAISERIRRRERVRAIIEEESTFAWPTIPIERRSRQREEILCAFI